jgi:hypothetical protein
MITMVVREPVYRSQEYLPPFFCVIIINKQVKDPVCEFLPIYNYTVFVECKLVALTLKGTTWPRIVR